MKLGASDRAAGDETDDRLAHVEGRLAVVQVEKLGERFRLALRVVGPELELRERERLGVVQVVDRITKITSGFRRLDTHPTGL